MLSMFARLLKERYLWVDSLSIAQDEMETMQIELDSMARIYPASSKDNLSSWKFFVSALIPILLSSELSIVAAGGTDAMYGLRGFRELSLQQDVKQEMFPLVPPENLIAPITRDQKTQSA